MRKLFFTLATAATLALTSCLDTVQEISLKEDGSGTVNFTNDMSTLIGLVKQMGGGADLEKAGDKKIDSTIVLATIIDSIQNLTPEEKAMVRGGTVRIDANFREDRFVTDLKFPFSKPSQIPEYNKLSGKIMAEVMKDKLADQGASDKMDGIPESSSIDDYYKLEFSEGELTRKIDKDKYVGAESDEFLKGMKDAAAMGLEMKTTYIINLPRPASKAEGKNVKLSEDKKKVTVTGTLTDFFDDPATFEFKIKY